MRAAYLTGLREFEIRQAPDPQLSRAGDVLLKVDVVGVCGSDMHYYRSGGIGSQVVRFPWIIGHECECTVVETGSEVTNVKVGQKVAVDPLINCGKCDQCTSGRSHTCRDQVFLGCPGQIEGALAEYIVMPASCCWALGEKLTGVQGVMVEPLSICEYARRLAGPTEGKAVGILGSGPIGLCVLKASLAAGDARVYSTDILDYRVELARDCGACWTANPRKINVVDEILRIEPKGLDFVFECAGRQETLDQAVDLLKPGGMVLMVGIQEEDRASFCLEQLRRKEVTIQNVRRQNECVPDTIDLIADGKICVDDLITHEYQLEETAAAFETVAEYADGVVKAMIHL